MAAFGFLSKPIQLDMLTRIYHNMRKLSEKKINKVKKIKVYINGSTFFYSCNEIIMLKAEGNYTHIYLSKNRKFLLTKTLKEVICDFPEPPFYRIHNSYCINLRHVAEYRKAEGGVVVMSNGICTAISRSRKDDFLTIIGKQQ